ncbi:type II secretion system F family protein [Peribacillus saganii]|uniref:Type II secretion system F family protein n=1 Tax=Peribacillus saganii TaxID=2303992 RepID=A0A372LTQ2_9BACI|nr:type II secretion system F family protein [Peribacillus saganii]RFU71573.1 type II secretion system F family protein [Peribacillus saganii]
MPVFRYQGRDKKGRKKAGRVTAENRREAVIKIREQGIAVISIEELTGLLYKEISVGQKKVKNQDLVIYIRQFSTLLKAGITVVEATNILARQTASKVLKKTLEDVAVSLDEGKPYSEAAEAHRHIYPPLFINMMRAGEAGGNMDEILERMAVYFEKQYQTRQKVKSAMMYPATVGFISIVIVIFLLSTVVPAFADMFASFGGELPWITRAILGMGDFFQAFWWLFLLLFISAYLGIQYIRSNKRTKYYFDLFMLRVPLFGKLLQKAGIARMTRTLSSLFTSSVPILQSLAIVEKVIGNEVLARVMKESRTSIEKGQSISVPMERHWAFPPMVTSMIAIGEKSGTMDLMLDKVADFYEMEVDNATDQIKSLIEPLMIVLLSFVVGGIVAAIAVPMFSIFETIK